MKQNLVRVAHRMVNRPLMIEPGKLDVLVRALGPRIGVAPGARMEIEEPLASAYVDAADDRGYEIQGGIAVIPISGVLTKKESWIGALSGCSSYEGITKMLTDAINDASVSGIMLQVDSPGGETTGCLELSDFIYNSRAKKPIWATADDYAFSAAYGLASAASKIYVTRMGAVGSVGVVVLHVEDSGFNKEQGFKYTYIFAGNKKVDGNPHEPLKSGAKKDIQDEIDRQYDEFVATVARNRSTSTDKIAGTEAGLFWGETSMSLMADKVGTIEDAINDLREYLGMMPGKPVRAAFARAPSGIQSTESQEPIAAVAEKGNQMKNDDLQPEALPAAPRADKKDGDDGTDDEDNSFCHACGTKLKKDANFCHACGQEAKGDGAGKFCSNCGTETRKGAKFCHGCGQEIKTEGKKAETEAPAPAAAPAAPEPAAAPAAAPAPAPAPVTEKPAAVTEVSRPKADIEAINALCQTAGKPELAGQFIAKVNASGKFVSVAEVSEELTAARVAESEKTMINSHVNPNAGSGGVQELEAQATALARQNKGQVTPALYTENPAVKMTKERAYAQMLEDNPEAYATFRDQHNAAPLLAQLQRAGVKFAQ